MPLSAAGGLGVECGDIKFAQIGRNVAIATATVPAPQFIPVAGSEIFFVEIAPGNVMAAVVSWQIDAVGLVVGGDDDAATIQHAMLA